MSTLVESFGSVLAIDVSRMAASRTVLVMGPAWSSDEAKATMPKREQRPYVGLRPTVPVTAAGCRIEPPVSVPVAARQRSPATAAAEPPDEPPGTRLELLFLARQGLKTGPAALVSFDEPMANSSMLVLPSITAPASQRFWVTVDS